MNRIQEIEDEIRRLDVEILKACEEARNVMRETVVIQKTILKMMGVG